jgi:hypothetical protein
VLQEIDNGKMGLGKENEHRIKKTEIQMDNRRMNIQSMSGRVKEMEINQQ